mmetsp:Transcript_28988/g.94452  ORF Transcript_28988/g.94452 Transcript_28988/m.94452 type:complete len:155 (-) Transcript_28988:53-517(-)
MLAESEPPAGAEDEFKSETAEPASKHGHTFTEQDLMVSVPRVAVHQYASGRVAIYEVHFANKVTGARATSYHRYSAFASFDAELNKAFERDHLRSSFPRLPPKKSKLFTDHTKPEFVEERRLALQEYLQRIVRLPRIAEHSVVRRFLQLDGGDE